MFVSQHAINKQPESLRPVHTRQQIVARNGNLVAAPVKVAVSGNNLLPFSATLLPGVDRPLGNPQPHCCKANMSNVANNILIHSQLSECAN